MNLLNRALNFVTLNDVNPVFSISADACTAATVAFNESCDVTVSFAPDSIDDFTNALVIESNDPAAPMVTITISGSGVTESESNSYTGSVETATGVLASLIPSGTEFSGTVSIVPTPNGTSINTDDLTEALLKMVEVTTGSTLFCFNYMADCAAADLEVPVTEIMPFELTFGASGCPTSGTIGLRAFSSIFGEEILITLDLFDRTFFIDGNNLGTATGAGGLDCADSDNDSIDDSVDNCTLVPNSDQRDTNGDGYGNACDPDLDNNGVVNFSDIVLWTLFFNTITMGDADFNGDGAANFGDYALYITYFLQPPGPSGVASFDDFASPASGIENVPENFKTPAVIGATFQFGEPVAGFDMTDIPAAAIEEALRGARIEPDIRQQ